MGGDRSLKFGDLITQQVAQAMLDRARRVAAAHGIKDADHILGAMVRHVAAPLYFDGKKVQRVTPNQ